MIIINLFGDPGAGKSAGSAYIFSKLKLKGINAEMLTEHAKDNMLENANEASKNQAYIFGKQYLKISRLEGKVDVVVTDAPLLHSVLYNDSPLLGKDFNKVVRNVFDSYNNWNYFVFRNKSYNISGRTQIQEQSNKLSYSFRSKLCSLSVPHQQIKGNEDDYDKIVNRVLQEIDTKKHIPISGIPIHYNDDDDCEPMWEGYE